MIMEEIDRDNGDQEGSLRSSGMTGEASGLSGIAERPIEDLGMSGEASGLPGVAERPTETPSSIFPVAASAHKAGGKLWPKQDADKDGPVSCPESQKQKTTTTLIPISPGGLDECCRIWKMGFRRMRRS